MQDEGILELNQMRQVQEQKQAEAEAKRLEHITAKVQSASSVTKHAAEVAVQVKETQEADLKRKKEEMEVARRFAARRFTSVLQGYTHKTASCSSSEVFVQYMNGVLADHRIHFRCRCKLLQIVVLNSNPCQSHNEQLLVPAHPPSGARARHLDLQLDPPPSSL
jgi:hypothetical protein